MHAYICESGSVPQRIVLHHSSPLFLCNKIKAGLITKKD